MRAFRLLSAAVAAALFTAAPASAAVWESTQEWSDAWEDRFIDWVTHSWTSNYFTDPNRPLTFGLELDCADAVYAMRILFAYENGLPFEINDPRKWGRKLSNEMTTWDGRRDTLKHENDDGSWSTYLGPEYTERDKVRAFIDFVSDVTSTLTLANDTYPVALNDLQPGDIYLEMGDHAFMVSSIAPTGAMTTLSASAPRANREMAVIEDFPSFVPDDSKKRDGYRRFKPAAHLTTQASKVPGASLSQWDAAKRVDNDPIAFGMVTQDALAQFKEPLSLRAQRLYDSLCEYANLRVDVVNVGIDYLRRMEENHGRKCMTIGEYAEYSTPSRDQKLEGKYKQLQAVTRDPAWASENFALKPVIESIYARGPSAMSDAELSSYCSVPVDVLNGVSLNLRHIREAIEDGRLSSDPHAPIAFRWGLMDRRWTPQCQVAKRGS